MKPYLKKYKGIWVCFIPGVIGNGSGETAREAYWSWRRAINAELFTGNWLDPSDEFKA